MATRPPPNEERIAREKIRWTAPDELKVEGPEGKTLVYRGAEAIEWKSWRAEAERREQPWRQE
jgi:hypothetical protein